MAVAKRKRGRPPKVLTDEAPSSPSAAVPPTEPGLMAAPMPVARQVKPSTLERVCARLGITLRDVKRYDGGGSTLEVVTEDGRRLVVERADLG